jgi:hypothetical protein
MRRRRGASVSGSGVPACPLCGKLPSVVIEGIVCRNERCLLAGKAHELIRWLVACGEPITFKHVGRYEHEPVGRCKPTRAETPSVPIKLKENKPAENAVPLRELLLDAQKDAATARGLLEQIRDAVKPRGKKLHVSTPTQSATVHLLHAQIGGLQFELEAERRNWAQLTKEQAETATDLFHERESGKHLVDELKKCVALIESLVPGVGLLGFADLPGYKHPADIIAAARIAILQASFGGKS